MPAKKKKGKIKPKSLSETTQSTAANTIVSAVSMPTNEITMSAEAFREMNNLSDVILKKIAHFLNKRDLFNYKITEEPYYKGAFDHAKSLLLCKEYPEKMTKHVKGLLDLIYEHIKINSRPHHQIYCFNMAVRNIDRWLTLFKDIAIQKKQPVYHFLSKPSAMFFQQHCHYMELAILHAMIQQPKQAVQFYEKANIYKKLTLNFEKDEPQEKLQIESVMADSIFRYANASEKTDISLASDLILQCEKLVEKLLKSNLLETETKTKDRLTKLQKTTEESKSRILAAKKTKEEALAKIKEKERQDKERDRIAAEERAKREAEEKTKKEADEKVKREAAEKAEREAEEKKKKEADEKVKKEAEEQEKAKREAEEKAKRETEAKKRQEEQETKIKQEAELKSKQEVPQKTPTPITIQYNQTINHQMNYITNINIGVAPSNLSQSNLSQIPINPPLTLEAFLNDTVQAAIHPGAPFKAYAILENYMIILNQAKKNSDWNIQFLCHTNYVLFASKFALFNLNLADIENISISVLLLERCVFALQEALYILNNEFLGNLSLSYAKFTKRILDQFQNDARQALGFFQKHLEFQRASMGKQVDSLELKLVSINNATSEIVRLHADLMTRLDPADPKPAVQASISAGRLH